MNTRSLGALTIAAGALASLGLMLWTGHRNQSVILMVLFAGWVLIPFVALVVADRLSRSWPSKAQVPVTGLMFTVPVGCSGLFIMNAFSPLARTAAAPYLVIPGVALVIIGMTFTLARVVARRSPN